MVEYSKVNVNLSDTQLKNWKLLSKKNKKQKIETTLTISLKCLMEMFYIINCYWQQDKKQN